MGLFFDIGQEDSNTVILQKLEWGYWWLHRKSALVDNPRMTVDYVIDFIIRLCEALFIVFLLSLPVFMSWIDSVGRFLTLVLFASFSITLLLSHWQIYILLKDARERGLRMSFHYFTPPLALAPLTSNENESVTVKEAGTEGYGIPPFWFSAYKIVIGG
ncbi:MAG: hypothetical protein GF416_00895 [Candidatus Altiarchaeales archaeon]|nr:hypothetical protein [Candidatus Altiarchaeales archaeon]MBD3415675.1 hypothetical protein [Candidatus Altiarchaeales archaeon]